MTSAGFASGISGLPDGTTCALGAGVADVGRVELDRPGVLEVAAGPVAVL